MVPKDSTTLCRSSYLISDYLAQIKQFFWKKLINYAGNAISLNQLYFYVPKSDNHLHSDRTNKEIKFTPKLRDHRSYVRRPYRNKVCRLPKSVTHVILAPVCNPTLQVIWLQIPCMEKAGVAVDALQLYQRLKY